MSASCVQQGKLHGYVPRLYKVRHGETSLLLWIEGVCGDKVSPVAPQTRSLLNWAQEGNRDATVSWYQCYLVNGNTALHQYLLRCGLVTSAIN